MSIVSAKNIGINGENKQKTQEILAIIKYFTDNTGLAVILISLAASLFFYAIDNSGAGAAIILTSLYIASNGAQGTYINALNTLKIRKAAAIFLIIDSLLKISFALCATSNFDKNSINTLLAVSLGAFVVYLLIRRHINLNFLLQHQADRKITSLARQQLLLSLPIYIPTIITAVKSVGDRWFLAMFTGVEELAAYSILLQIGYAPIVLCFGIIQTFIAPKIYSLSAKKNVSDILKLKKLIKNILISIAAAALPLFIASALYSDFALQLITSKDYQYLARYLPYFIISGSFTAFSGILHLAIIGACEPSLTAKITTSTIITSTAISGALVYSLGFTGAVTALPLSSAITTCLYWIVLSKFSLKN